MRPPRPDRHRLRAVEVAAARRMVAGGMSQRAAARVLTLARGDGSRVPRTTLEKALTGVTYYHVGPFRGRSGRDPRCPMYDSCLETAVRARWDHLSCGPCPVRHEPGAAAFVEAVRDAVQVVTSARGRP